MTKHEPPTLAKMYQKKLLDSTAMSQEVQHWRRLLPDHKNRSYEWLRECVETSIRLDREDKNQDGLQADHRQPVL